MTPAAAINEQPENIPAGAYLPAAITTHHPLDLVIIMVGGNDLKAAYNRTPYRIALGAGHLIDICNTIGGGLGTTCKSPKVLLICPPPLSPSIEQGSVFPEMFKGGLQKTKYLSKLYEGIARLGGADFFDAGTVITTDGPDGAIRSRAWCSLLRLLRSRARLETIVRQRV